MADDAGLLLRPVRVEEPQPRRFTLDDLLRWRAAGAVDPDARFELIDGTIYDMPSEGELHVDYKAEIARHFCRQCSLSRRVIVSSTLFLAPHDAPRPDLYVFDAELKAWPLDGGCLSLVVEVADSSFDHDRRVKAQLYARYGVAEYWIVDVQRRRVLIHRDAVGGRYLPPEVKGFADALTPLRLPEISLVIDDLPHVGSPR